MPNFTAGPWYWHRDSYGRVSLRTPDRGNLVVMDFCRKGMNGATVRFAEWPGIYSGVQRQRLGGILEEASHWSGPAPGTGINHPDARLITAAPAQFALLDEALDLVPRMSDDDPIAPALVDWCRRVRTLRIETTGGA